MNFFTRAICALSLFALLGCSSGEQVKEMASAEDPPTQPQIIESKTDCIVQLRNQKLKTNLLPPCFFVSSNEGAILSFSYPALKVDRVFIVAGTPPSMEELKSESWSWAHSRGGKRRCASQMTGLLRKNAQGFLVPKIFSRRICENHAVDEKEFWALAHDFKVQ
jgi:hypothetical protein